MNIFWTLEKLHINKLVTMVNSKCNLDSPARNYSYQNSHTVPQFTQPPNSVPLDTMYSTCTLSKRSPWAKAPHSKACDTSAMQALCASTSSPCVSFNQCWDVSIGQSAAIPGIPIPKWSKYDYTPVIKKKHQFHTHTHPSKKQTTFQNETFDPSVVTGKLVVLRWGCAKCTFASAKKFNTRLPWSFFGCQPDTYKLFGTSHSLHLRKQKNEATKVIFHRTKHEEQQRL